jgi:cephalosporin hydroxylase
LDNDRVEKIRAMRRKLAADGPARVRAAGDFERISIPKSDCDALRDLLNAERANTAIEIGLAYGSSALAISEALLIVGSDHARHVSSTPLRIGSSVPEAAPLLKQVSLASVH